MSAKPVQIESSLTTASRHIAQDVAGFSMQANQSIDRRFTNPEQLSGLYNEPDSPL
ncbi:MAG: hypothetical protein GY811_07915 [Myxococcales bacterium]|nr:hypothetical protein [Myxococcales bacterium]